VHSLDPKVDPVGACVGVRGSRIKNIVDEVAGEKIDIVRWHDSSQVLIGYALKPAEVADIALCFELGRATVVVNEDQLSLAIGKRGQNVRLAARLTGWDIDILTPVEFNAGLDVLERTLREVAGAEPTLPDRLIAMGMVSVADVQEVGVEPLVEELQIDQAVAEAVVQRCQAEARRTTESPRKSAAAQTAIEADEIVPEAADEEQQEPEGVDVTGDAGDVASAEPQA
jgi:N utilization substance protein A